MGFGRGFCLGMICRGGFVSAEDGNSLKARRWRLADLLFLYVSLPLGHFVLHP